MDDEVFLVHNIIEEMNLGFLNSAYSKMGRKPVVEPRTMLKILVFAYLNRKYSVRDIEDCCKYDLRFRWLLDNGKAPDHVTVSRFKNLVNPFMDEILTQLVELLIQQNEIDLKSIYIDGTKIEANANRYTFVWKKSILKYQENLVRKVKKYFEIDTELSNENCKKLILIEFNNVRNTCKSQNIIFVYGQGKRKTEEQRKYELLEEWLDKLEKYETHLQTMENRNSYSKTDKDATFMRLKDDHMKNGQLKPAYNIQCATNGNYVVDIEGFSNPADMRTLPHFIDKLLDKYPNKINRVVADSGYESEENYLYLKQKHINAYIKPSNYEIKKKRKYKKDISRKENMKYFEDNDYYLCHNNKQLEFEKNITTKEGIAERMNRSIQAEGIFSYIKTGMNYSRFRHKSMAKIIAEMKLLSIAINIKKFSNKIRSNNIGFTKYKQAI